MACFSRSFHLISFVLIEMLQIDVAVKTLHNEHLPVSRCEFLREAEVMTSLNHHCVVKLIGEDSHCCRFIKRIAAFTIHLLLCISALSQGPPLMMVQELVPLGSMLAYLLEFPDRVNPNYELKLWASQIACGNCSDHFYSGLFFGRYLNLKCLLHQG